MKLKDINPEVFQINEKIYFDVSPLYFDYGDKEIYDLLKQNTISNIISSKIKVSPTSHYKGYDNSFSYNQRENITQNYDHFYFTLINALTPLEQETLLDFVLTPPQKSFAVTMLKNPEIKLNSSQFDKVFNLDKNHSHFAFALKEALVENKSIVFTEEQLNQGLLNWEGGLSVCFAERGEACIRSDTIDKLIKDIDKGGTFADEVLLALLKNKNLQLNHNQIEALLTDDFKLRVECARNYQLPFTPEQIQRGLNDEGYDDCDGYDDSYEDYNQSDVIDAFMENPYITLPNKEVTTILNGKNHGASLETLIQKDNIQFDKEQIDIIINRGDFYTLEYLKNKSVQLNDHQFLKLLYKDSNWPKYLAKIYLSKEDVKVSDIIFGVLQFFPDADIKSVVETRGDSIVESKNQKKPKM